AYTTRVGGGPFPTELIDDTGRHLAARGNEFGATTGRPRRCGWFDAAALKRSIQINGVSGLCVTKLDVLDGVEKLRLAVGYRVGERRYDLLPAGADALAECEPIYEEVPGWKESTVGLKRLEELPKAARNYLARIEAICGVPVDIISTGPEREETIVLRHPFQAAA
ncbi:adenylosuccinate synthetase, partial [Pelomicrobium sp.]|uniref:adenylosuccinate synthetase n=1 Tax=Pelomicrobium sp. TaxID=2815319 RepID=UPI002FDCEA5D